LDAQQEIGGFDLNFKVAMDYDTWAKLYQAGYNITLFDRPLVVYAGGGLSTRHAEIALADHSAVKTRLRDTPLKRLIGRMYDQLHYGRESWRKLSSGSSYAR